MPNFVITLGFDKCSHKQKKKIRDYLNFDGLLFLKDLDEIELSTKLSHFVTVYKHLMQILDNHAPIEVLSQKETKIKLKP